MDDRVDALARRAEGRQVRGVQRNKALVGRQRQRRSVRHDETVDADAPGLGARAGVLGGVGGGEREECTFWGEGDAIDEQI